MEEKRSQAKVFLGVLFLFGGLLAMLSRLDIYSFPYYGDLFNWKVLLMAIGTYKLIKGEHTIGIILVGIGLWFHPFVHEYVPSIRVIFWPLTAIIIGLVLILRRNKDNKEKASFKASKSNNGDLLDEVSVFGGSSKICSSSNFRGGEIVSIFGGSKVDLRQAELAQGGADLEVVSIFGGSALEVPEDWEIEISVTSIFGGFKDARRFVNKNLGDPSKTLRITGVVIFGGGELKN